MGRKKILLVDDSSTVLLLERMILSKNEYDVVTAKDGLEGVEKALAEKPDLIVMDVMMPRMDGYEVLKRIKNDPDFKNIPIVMLTSQGLSSDQGAAFQGGADLYIEKPFSTKKILTIVENVLGLD